MMVRYADVHGMCDEAEGHLLDALEEVLQECSVHLSHAGFFSAGFQCYLHTTRLP